MVERLAGTSFITVVSISPQQQLLPVVLCYLVIQVRVRTEAPLPQLREQTDQPPHAAHSFLKCSCLRARADRPEEGAPEGPHVGIHEDWSKRREKTMIGTKIQRHGKSVGHCKTVRRLWWLHLTRCHAADTAGATMGSVFCPKALQHDRRSWESHHWSGSCSASINESYSWPRAYCSTIQMCHGVPQGSVLGLVLFTLYILPSFPFLLWWHPFSIFMSETRTWHLVINYKRCKKDFLLEYTSFLVMFFYLCFL